MSIASFLAMVAAIAVSAALLYGNDRAVGQFIAAPSPARSSLIRVLSLLGLIATLVFYGAIAALTVVAAFGLASFGQVILNHPTLARPVATIGVVAGLTIAAILRRQISKRASHSTQAQVVPAEAMPPNSGVLLPWFAAMQYYALILNRTFKVYVAPQMLCAAKVAGLVASPMNITPEMHRPEYWVQTLEASLYERLDVTSPMFLQLNPQNFQIRWSEIEAVAFKSGRKWGMGNVPHSGRIVLKMRSGGQRELILLGDQDGNALTRTLETAMNANRSA